MSERCPNKVYPKECGCGNKGEKVAIVATANTVVEPNAVVVLSFDTVVA